MVDPQMHVKNEKGTAPISGKGIVYALLTFIYPGFDCDFPWPEKSSPENIECQETIALWGNPLPVANGCAEEVFGVDHDGATKP